MRREKKNNFSSFSHFRRITRHIWSQVVKWSSNEKALKTCSPSRGTVHSLSSVQRRINFRTGKKYHRVRKRAVQVVQVIKVRQAVEIYYRRDEKRFEERGGSSNASVIRMVERKKERKGKKERAHPIRSIGLVKEHIPQIVRNIRPLPPLCIPCHFIMQPTYRHVAFQPSYSTYSLFFPLFLLR